MDNNDSFFFSRYLQGLQRNTVAARDLFLCPFKFIHGHSDNAMTVELILISEGLKLPYLLHKQDAENVIITGLGSALKAKNHWQSL